MKRSLRPCTVSQARGWLLPSALFALLASLASARLFHHAARSNSQILGDTRLGQRLNERLKESVASSGPIPDVCEIRDGVLLGIQRRYTVCGERSYPFTTLPPVRLPGESMDFELLTRNSLPCSSTSSWRWTSGSIAPATSTSCVSPTQHAGSLIVMKNLAGTSLQVTSSNTNTQSVVSPGFISLTGELIVSQDLLVVAGGNISLGVIRNPTERIVRVSLFSSLGDISVTRVEGDVSILAAGRKKIAVPPTTPSTQYPLPPFRPRTIRGFEVTR